MNKRDKLKNIEQVNLMLEQSYIKSKVLINEVNYWDITKGLTVSSVIGAIVWAAFIHPNNIYITTNDGQEITAKKGESFIGVVKSIKHTRSHNKPTHPKQHGNIVVIETYNHNIVEFYTDDDNVNDDELTFNIGDTIKITAGSSFSLLHNNTSYEKQ